VTGFGLSSSPVGEWPFYWLVIAISPWCAADFCLPFRAWCSCHREVVYVSCSCDGWVCAVRVKMWPQGVFSVLLWQRLLIGECNLSQTPVLAVTLHLRHFSLPDGTTVAKGLTIPISMYPPCTLKGILYTFPATVSVESGTRFDSDPCCLWRA